MRTKKLVTSGVAVALAGALLFGGTFAWQSISQTALNEVTASINPGGRLHDDFNDVTEKEGTETMTFDKNVYVENFTELANNGVQVFARVRLDEYMEFGAGAGTLSEDGTKPESNKAVSLVPGATLEDKSTWTPHKFSTEPDTTDPFHEYWNWTMGGQTTYMPTFNKNKDSLEADINGTSKDSFATYVDYTLPENSSKTAIAIYDVDAAEEVGGGIPKEVDEIVQENLTASQFINAADSETLTGLKSQITDVDTHIKTADETHTVKDTLPAEIMTMERYMARLASTAAGTDDFTGTGDFWVYDTDGWAYWANPIDPATATGLLLDGISRTNEIINQDWYYAINVVAQFVTYDDLGQDDNTGFYDIEQGTYPSADALTLLKTIGVDVPTATVSDLAGLEAALEQGGIITVTDNIALTAPLDVSASCVLDLNGHTISPESGSSIWDEASETWSLLSVQNGATVVVNGGTFAAAENDSYAVDVRDGSKVVINDGSFKGNIASVYVYEGEAVINGGSFSIQQTGASGSEYAYVLNCFDSNWSNGTAKITVYGGSFENFDPANCAAEGPGTNFVADGYTSTLSGTTYTVTKTTVSAGG